MVKNTDIRQVSNLGNIRKIIVSIIVLLLCVVAEIVRTAWLGSFWPGDKIDIIVLVVAIICLVVMLVSILDYRIVKNTNEVLKNPLYGFDYQKELATYVIIGRESKKIKNGAQRFSKYSEWKNYLETTYSEQQKCDDFYRFLKRLLRDKRNSRDLQTTVVVPVEIAALTAFCSANREMGETETIIMLIILMGFLVSFLTINILNLKEEVNFIEDYIEVLFGNKKE